MKRSRRDWLFPFHPDALRPPGALPEDEFLSACIKCGRCVASCPYQSLKPAGWSHGLGVGTPIVEPRETPCYVCMICPEVCPSGALRPLKDVEIDMGEAEIDTTTCYAYLGILCRTCVDACPWPGVAIKQDLMLQPKVDPEHCVGCGICQHVCPSEEESIRVVRKS